MGDLDKIEQAAAGPVKAEKVAAAPDKFDLVTPSLIKLNKRRAAAGRWPGQC